MNRANLKVNGSEEWHHEHRFYTYGFLQRRYRSLYLPMKKAGRILARFWNTTSFQVKFVGPNAVCLNSPDLLEYTAILRRVFIVAQIQTSGFHSFWVLEC